MINRALLRIKLLQMLYAYYKSGNSDLKLGEAELQHSIKKAYDLYYSLLDLSVETTRYASLLFDAAQHKLQKNIRNEELNRERFASNRFVKQLSSNEQFLSYVSENLISWNDHEEVVRGLLEQIESSTYYDKYLNEQSDSYDADKELWIKIYKKEISNNPILEEAMEDMSIYWMDDLDIVLSFVLKTCRTFSSDSGANQPLLPMYKDQSDVEFVSRLYQAAILNADQYRVLIDKYTSNWDLDRIAFMDILLMQLSIAELLTFPTIPINVTLNEYIELAKIYSTTRSANFVNGVLDKIVAELKKEGKLQKL